MSIDMFLHWLNSLDPIWVHLVLFVLLLVEGIGVPGIPFELVWLVEGALIQQGRTTLVEAILWGAVGNWIGNVAGYYLGERGIRLLPERARTAMGVEQVRVWLDRWGGLVVVFSRWMGVIRTPFILYAGAAGMPFPKYAFYSAIGALSWVTVWQVSLWYFGEVFMRLWEHYQPYVIAGFVVIGILSVVYMLRRPARRRRSEHESERVPDSGDTPAARREVAAHPPEERRPERR